MENNLVEQAKKFLYQTLMDNELNYETSYPWRKDSKHVIFHCYRVYSIAMKIVGVEKENLSKEEILIIQISAILHDIGKVDVMEGHAAKGAKIVEAWLCENPDIDLTSETKKRIVSSIRNHSNKEEETGDLCSAILKDADILDEIGALSIFMTSNKIDKHDPYFFNELKEKLVIFELPYCDEKMKTLKTEAAKKILIEKIEFIKGFIAQLEIEIDGTDELYMDSKNL